MKKILFSFIALLALSACSDDDFGSDSSLTPQSFQVHVNFDSDNYEGLPAENVDVTLKNVNTGDDYQMSSTTNGVAVFETIIPGTYNVTASLTLNADTFEGLFGYAPTAEEVIFNGAQEQVIINTNTTSASLELNAARIGDLVIKQIYYGGSDAVNGAMFRDQFIEIHNNANEVIFADGLYIAQLTGKSSTTVENYTLPNGQYDWSQSNGMSIGSAANTDYVYADYVFQVPGNGETHPIEPGESIVIAQNALNHKEPLVDNNGDPISIGDPSLTVDLSDADFEVYLGDFRESIGEEPYQWDIQNPAVEDMSIAYWGRENYFNNNKDFIIDTKGRDSFAIFRVDQEDFNAYENFPLPSISEINDNTSFYIQIPNANIIDGIDLQSYNPGTPRPKILPSEIDASSISTDGIFNSQSVMRKTKSEIDDRIILEDKNNTAEDFKLLDKAEPRGF